jgi:hypothetical protein
MYILILWLKSVLYVLKGGDIFLFIIRIGPDWVQFLTPSRRSWGGHIVEGGMNR